MQFLLTKKKEKTKGGEVKEEKAGVKDNIE